MTESPKKSDSGHPPSPAPDSPAWDDPTGMTVLHNTLRLVTEDQMQHLLQRNPYGSNAALALALLTAAIWKKPPGWLAAETGIAPAAEHAILSLIIAEAMVPGGRDE